MPTAELARQEVFDTAFPTRVAGPPLVAPTAGVGRTIAALAWAVMASTTHRIRRGECALLAINVSLIIYQGAAFGVGIAQALVSTLAILVMYAFNDLYDAPADWNNPKKDRALIATWVEHRTAGLIGTVGLKLVTLAVAFAMLGPRATAAAASVMTVNVIYSTMLKGVPIADVVAVGVWGTCYAGIVDAPLSLLVLVGLMTAICHLFQALGDRVTDAENGIETTAVRSATLSRNVLIVLCAAMVALLMPSVGVAVAVTACAPLVIFFLVRNGNVGWLLTKAYYAVLWLYLLGFTGAAY